MAASRAQDEQVHGAMATERRSERLVRRLSRRTSSGRFVPEVDGLRFVAITFVVGYHIDGYLRHGQRGQGAIHWIAASGAHGVEIFFVISGFILALPFAGHWLLDRDKPSTRAYYLRRLTRLEPPYVVAMIGFAIASVLAAGMAAGFAAERLGWSLLYLHSLRFGDSNPINGVTWSLEIEVQFYLLAPWLCTVFMIRSKIVRRAVLVATMAAAVAIQAVFIDGGRLGFSLLNYLQFFAAGLLVADIYLVDWKEAPFPSKRWDVVSIFGWPALIIALHNGGGRRLLFVPLVILLFCAALKGIATRQVLRQRWIVILGGMCYSIYLVHYPVVSEMGRIFARVVPGPEVGIIRVGVHACLLLTAVLAVSVAFFILIERPCMKRDWWKDLNLN